jgi:hypothetical protein
LASILDYGLFITDLSEPDLRSLLGGMPVATLRSLIPFYINGTIRVPRTFSAEEATFYLTSYMAAKEPSLIDFDDVMKKGRDLIALLYTWITKRIRISRWLNTKFSEVKAHRAQGANNNRARFPDWAAKNEEDLKLLFMIHQLGYSYVAWHTTRMPLDDVGNLILGDLLPGHLAC